MFYKLFGICHKELKVSGLFLLYIYHVPNSDAVEIDSKLIRDRYDWNAF